jgi:hypothetical protein
MTLDFLIDPQYSYTTRQPGNIVLNCAANASIIDALVQALNVAYPTIPVVTKVSTNYTASQPLLGHYQTLPQLSKDIQSVTKPIMAPGVQVTMNAPTNTILISDGSQPTTPKPLNFTDFIGQPTWVDVNTMQVTTVMRADIQVGDTIQMPQGLPGVPGVVTSPPTVGALPLKYQTTFTGPFTVVAVRQVGNFRDPDGAAWVTMFRCVPAGTPKT